MYQVLARKYRPKNFSELVGQTHVSKALGSALERGRLHHAYLFTGTRGVGKTTIARILSKCLNCETGITATPCGVCNVCKSIDEGRFVDLIEIDAASRTKVEDTRELLDNVPYAPTQGRYKVYLIDEVHMLSTSSFNALLKTLEEPPEHVKFLLATTDPQKLPITVLSRCLQFTLRPLPRADIRNHLADILTQEQISFEDAALWQLAEGAQGSVRDALSLTDQAIAFGQGAVKAQDVQEMLGLLNKNQVAILLQAIHSQNSASVSQILQDLKGQAVDVKAVLDQFISLLHAVAVCQHLPNMAFDGTAEEQALLKQLATTISPQDLQLYYQIAIQSRSDMRLAVSPQQGFDMCVLRLLAFNPLPAMQMQPPITAEQSNNADTAQKKNSVISAQAPAPILQGADSALPNSSPMADDLAEPIATTIETNKTVSASITPDNNTAEEEVFNTPMPTTLQTSTPQATQAAQASSHLPTTKKTAPLATHIVSATALAQMMNIEDTIEPPLQTQAIAKETPPVLPNTPQTEKLTGFTIIDDDVEIVTIAPPEKNILSIKTETSTLATNIPSHMNNRAILEEKAKAEPMQKVEPDAIDLWLADIAIQHPITNTPVTQVPTTLAEPIPSNFPEEAPEPLPLSAFDDHDFSPTAEHDFSFDDDDPLLAPSVDVFLEASLSNPAPLNQALLETLKVVPLKPEPLDAELLKTDLLETTHQQIVPLETNVTTALEMPAPIVQIESDISTNIMHPNQHNLTQAHSLLSQNTIEPSTENVAKNNMGFTEKNTDITPQLHTKNTASTVQHLSTDLTAGHLSDKRHPQQILAHTSIALDGDWTLEKWDCWLREADISPAVLNLGQHGIMQGAIGSSENQFFIAQAHHLLAKEMIDSLISAIKIQWQHTTVQLQFASTDTLLDTPLQLKALRLIQAKERAMDLMLHDPKLQPLIQTFGATINKLAMVEHY